VLATSLKFICR